MDDQLHDLVSVTIMNLFLVGLYGTLFIHTGSRWLLVGLCLFSVLTLLNLISIVGVTHERKIPQGQHIQALQPPLESGHGSDIHTGTKPGPSKIKGPVPSQKQWEGPVYRQGERSPYRYRESIK